MSSITLKSVAAGKRNSAVDTVMDVTEQVPLKQLDSCWVKGKNVSLEVN